MTATLTPNGWHANPRQTDRLRVDQGATHFFKGRQFRSFQRLNITTGQKFVVKATVPVDTILTDFTVQLKQGSVEIRTVLAPVTESGSFNVALPIIPCNSMSIVEGFPTNLPQPLVTLFSGGQIVSGGTERDVFYCQTAGQGNQSLAAGAEQEDIRGVPGSPGTPSVFYFEFIASGTDNAIGVVHMRWEERPSA